MKTPKKSGARLGRPPKDNRPFCIRLTPQRIAQLERLSKKYVTPNLYAQRVIIRHLNKRFPEEAGQQ